MWASLGGHYSASHSGHRQLGSSLPHGIRRSPLARSPPYYLLGLESQTLCWAMGTKVPALVERGSDDFSEVAHHQWAVGG